MDDEDFIERINRARRAGDRDDVQRLTRDLIAKHYPKVKALVALKVPAHLVEDVAGDAILRALGARFDGEAVGQFHKWLGTIVQRHIADHIAPQRRVERCIVNPGQQFGELFGVSHCRSLPRS